MLPVRTLVIAALLVSACGNPDAGGPVVSQDSGSHDTVAVLGPVFPAVNPPAARVPAADAPAASMPADGATSHDVTPQRADAAPDGRFDPLVDDFTMSAAAQRRMWDVEHFAFVLTQVQPRVRKALVARRADSLGRFFADGFVALVPGGLGRATSHGPVEVVAWAAAGETTREVDAEAFAAALVDRVERFAGESHVRVHFELLSPVDRSDLEGRWTGTCTITIEGTLAEGAGHAQFGQESRFEYARMADDLRRAHGWITSAQVLREWEIRMPAPVFAETTAGAGIDVAAMRDRWRGDADWNGPPSWSTVLFDYDGDGHLDVLALDRGTHLFRGLGNGRFEDVTVAAGLAPVDGRTRIGATAVDADGDGDDDLLCDEGRGRRLPMPVMYENRGDGTFVIRNRPQDSVPPVMVGRGSVADFDGDGRLDVYVCNGGMRSFGTDRRWVGDRTSPDGLLLRNVGDFHFEDVTATAGALEGNRDIKAAAWLDMDADGDPDLVLAHRLGENLLLENRGDGTFARHEMNDRSGGFSMGLDAGDLDGDGAPDLYVASVSSRAAARIVANLSEEDYPAELLGLMADLARGSEIVRNRGQLDLEREMTIEGARAPSSAYGPVLLDMDGDGLLDVYCASGTQSVDPNKADGSSCFWRAAVARPTRRGGAMEPLGPIDVARGELWVRDPLAFPRTENLGAYEPNQVLLNVGGLRFVDVSTLSGAGIVSDGRGAVAGDLDGDLAPDLVVRSVGGGPLRVFLNRFPQRGRLTVSLRGSASNSRGIGARVEVSIGERRVTRFVTSNNTSCGQQVPRARFGLGDATGVDRLRVVWPSGAVQEFSDVPAGRHVRITEGEDAVRVLGRDTARRSGRLDARYGRQESGR